MVENLLKLLIKMENQAFYKPIDVHSVKNATGESASLLSMWNTVNQLCMHDSFFGVISFYGYW